MVIKTIIIYNHATGSLQPTSYLDHASRYRAERIKPGKSGAVIEKLQKGWNFVFQIIIIIKEAYISSNRCP